jgi:hypothetical protein
MGQITAHGNPHPSFSSLSFFPLYVRRGFDEKVLLSAVQYKFDTLLLTFFQLRIYAEYELLMAL